MGRPPIDETGNRYGTLTVLSVHSRPVSGGLKWVCVCDCGEEKVTSGGALRLGRIARCSSCRSAAVSARSVTHGHSVGEKPSGTYVSWSGMLTRATNPNIKQSRDYSLRGITVCDRWRDFECFLLDMGERPEGMTLDRIDVDGNYEPGNCRWADRKTQNNNTRAAKLKESL